METRIKTLAENVPPGAGLVSMVKQTTSVRVAVLHFILKVKKNCELMLTQCVFWGKKAKNVLQKHIGHYSFFT